MDHANDPWHAHVYYDQGDRGIAERLHRELRDLQAGGRFPELKLVGRMIDRAVGPHPKPQFEIHVLASAVARVHELLAGAGLTALIHPLTDDDLADHTTLARWLGEPLPLDESVLDPPGRNQGIARFGKVDY